MEFTINEVKLLTVHTSIGAIQYQPKNSAFHADIIGSKVIARLKQVAKNSKIGRCHRLDVMQHEGQFYRTLGTHITDSGVEGLSQLVNKTFELPFSGPCLQMARIWMISSMVLNLLGGSLIWILFIKEHVRWIYTGSVLKNNPTANIIWRSYERYHMDHFICVHIV